MVESDHRRIDDEPSTWLERVVRARVILLTAVLVFLAFAATGTLSTSQALIGFSVLAAAALIRISPKPYTAQIALIDTSGGTSLADPALEATIAGLPDPVIVLDRDEKVVAFNSPARTIAINKGEKMAG